jgi:very-short-patch-repair endonuclease/predicted transcriptional regulator of viral defense system
MRVKARPPDLLIAGVAESQHGVIARSQLLELGLGRNAIQERLATGKLHRLHAGVYAVGHSVLPARASFIAAVLACGPGALLSYRSAAELWGLFRSATSKIDVTVPGRRGQGKPGIVVHRPRMLRPDDCAMLENIPVTSLARTLLDFAAGAQRRQVERAVEEAERLRLFDLRAVERVLERSRGHRGRVALVAAIAEATHSVPWTRSELERRFLRLCRAADLPEPAVNLWVEGHEVDAAWLEQKLVVELDSREHHLTPAAFERDRKRDTKLQLAGYRVIRVTQRRIERESPELVGELRTLLGLDSGR